LKGACTKYTYAIYNGVSRARRKEEGEGEKRPKKGPKCGIISNSNPRKRLYITYTVRPS